jgi:hypothetical protein
VRRRRWLAVASVAAASSGCVVHTHGPNAPGHVDLTQRTLAKTPAEDPGEHGLHVHVTPLFGAVGSETPRTNGLTFGFEVGAEPFSLPKSHKEAFFDGLQHIRFRPVIGWMAYRGNEGADTFGPLYAEVQWMLPFDKAWFGYLQLGAGATVNPVVGGGGPQTTVCLGFHPLVGGVCGRMAYFADGTGGELTFLYSITTAYFEHVWRK